MHPVYAALCGITEEELLSNFRPELSELAVGQNLSGNACLSEARRMYNGYRFHPNGPGAYSPFSTLSLLDAKELKAGDVDAFLTRLRSFFTGIQPELNDQTERHYHVAFYLVFRLLGQFIEAEVKSANGRADAVVWTPDRIFVFEFKLNGTAEDALEQIDAKGYGIPYEADGRAVVKVGVEFDKATRNLGRWLIA